MTYTEKAIAISLFVICASFGMTMMNELNAAYYDSFGFKLVNKDVSSPISYNSMGSLNDSQTSLNNTMNQMLSFQKPEDITEDFSFYQGLKVMRILSDILINSTWGFPKFLVTAFGMPVLFLPPMLILINVSHILVVIYIVLGKVI